MITHDLRCVACDGEIVDAKHGESFNCSDVCGKSYPFVLGVPYIGEFDENDIIGLIEIAANLSNRKSFGVTPEEVERWEDVLEEFHNSDNKEGLKKIIQLFNHLILLIGMGNGRKLKRLLKIST